MKHVRAHTLLLLALAPGLACTACTDASWAASRIFIAGGVSGEEYASGVFARLGEVWEPPQGIYGEYGTEIELLIDSSGMLQDCAVKRSSGHDTFDASACGAAHKIGRFAPPPDGHPIRITCTLKVQKPADPVPDPDEELKRQVRERSQRDREYKVREAGYAEEDARARAEAVARERGESFSGYEFVPGQYIPGAKELRERTPIKPLPEPRSKPQTEATEQEKTGEAVVPGPVISRYPPKPELTDLVIESEEIRAKAEPKSKAAPKPKPEPASAAPARQGDKSGKQITPRASEAQESLDRNDRASAATDRKTAKERASAASGQTGTAKKGASSDWVIPQPPLPPKNVTGKVIDPAAPAMPFPLSEERKAEIAAETAAARAARAKRKAEAAAHAAQEDAAARTEGDKGASPTPPVPAGSKE